MQNNMIASFSFTSTTHVTQWSNYLLITQWAVILAMIKFNASTGEEYCTRFVAFDITEARWLHNFLYSF